VSITFEPESHTYTVGGRTVPHVTGILKAAGLVDDRWFTEWARQRGTAVHVACHLWNSGDLDEATVDERIAGYLDGWRRAVSELGLVVKESEKLVYSKTYSFAGTVDVVAELGGKNCIIDIKTGDPGRIAGVQLAGYEVALADTLFGKEVMRRFAVRLFDDGTYAVTEYTNFKDRACFMAALTIAHWLEENRGSK
jgi:hypothetical protein